MPSSPKILKESMIQAALELLLEKGNAGVRLRAVSYPFPDLCKPIQSGSGLPNLFGSHRRTLTDL